MTVATYVGVVQKGHIRLTEPATLPEGSQVYVVVPIAVPSAVPITVNERTARHKAARWLAENVGDMVMPGPATLTSEKGHRVWLFPAMLGSPFTEPRGPVGHVKVNAADGTVLSPPTLAGEIVYNAEHLADTVLPSEN